MLQPNTPESRERQSLAWENVAEKRGSWKQSRTGAGDGKNFLKHSIQLILNSFSLFFSRFCLKKWDTKVVPLLNFFSLYHKKLLDYFSLLLIFTALLCCLRRFLQVLPAELVPLELAYALAR